MNAWTELSKEFNSLCGEVYRDSKILKNKYENLKKKTKERFAREKAAIKKTGGGPPEDGVIHNIDNEIKDIIGVQITGIDSEFDDDNGTADSHAINTNDIYTEVEVEIVEDTEDKREFPCSDWSTYTPEMFRTPKSAPLRKGTPAKEQSHCQKKQLCNKMAQWADTKKELADVQVQCFLEEHKLKLMQDRYNTEMDLKKQESTVRIRLMEEEHAAKVEILKTSYK